MGSSFDPEPAASLLHSYSRTLPVVVFLHIWSPWHYKKELLAQRKEQGRGLEIRKLTDFLSGTW